MGGCPKGLALGIPGFPCKVELPTLGSPRALQVGKSCPQTLLHPEGSSLHQDAGQQQQLPGSLGERWVGWAGCVGTHI